MKLSIQRLARRNKWTVALMCVSLILFAFLDNSDKRMFGQVLTILSFTAVSIVAYARLSCTRIRLGKSVWRAVKENDFRPVAALFQNLHLQIFFLAWIGHAACAVGAASQVYNNQVADKPIPFHVGVPLCCLAMLRILTYLPQQNKKDGTSGTPT